MNISKRIAPILFNLFGSAIVAFGLFNVHSVSDITEGGVLGLTLLLEHWLKISPSVSSFVLNALCYVFGAAVLGKGFILYSAVSGISFAVFYAVFEQIGPLFPRISDYPLFAAVIGALFVGIGVGICVRNKGAPSGDDALAMSLSRITLLKIQWVYFISDVTVLMLSFTYIPVRNVLYSLVTVMLSSQIIGLISRKNTDDY